MRRISFLILLILPFAAIAQQNLLTLEEAIGTALKNNYNILMAKNDSISFAVDRSYVYAGFLPRLNGAASQNWNVNAQKVELANGTKRDTSGLKSSNLQAALNLNWTMFDGFKMFAIRDRVIEQNKLGSLTVKDRVVTTVADIITNYYNIVQSKLQLIALDEQIVISEERVKLADRKFSVGLGAKPELLQAKVDLNAQKAARLRQVTLTEQLKVQLNQLMSVETSSTYEVMDTIPLNTTLQYGDLHNDIVNTNPSLLITKKNIDVATILIRERKADFFPTINFNTSYVFNRLTNKAVVDPFTALFRQNSGFNAGFTLAVPIFNNFNTRRLVEQAKLDVEYQQLFFKNQLSQVDMMLSNAFKAYELEKKSLTLELENIELARENVTIQLERFRQGVSTYLELREAQISMLQANARLISAMYNTKVAETELLRLKGDLVR